jgi:signal transduction histidine kinase
MLYCDEARLREVITIILENSFNRTPRDGQISVEARERRGDVVISIFDTGVQIPTEMLTKMFDYVGYIDMDTPGANLKGGLELLLAKSIIEVMGGKIWAEHGPVEGNIFYISMPRASPSYENQVNT